LDILCYWKTIHKYFTNHYLIQTRIFSSIYSKEFFLSDIEHNMIITTYNNCTYNIYIVKWIVLVVFFNFAKLTVGKELNLVRYETSNMFGWARNWTLWGVEPLICLDFYIFNLRVKRFSLLSWKSVNRNK